MTLTFEAAEITQAFAKTLSRFSALLAKHKEVAEVESIEVTLQTSLDQYNQEGLLGVAFVGQYSAGKSTIISALTNQRDIKIDANIATDRVSDYLWNGVKVIDTPGLFTEKQDHDDITYTAIAKADLLIFCLTYMLFDDVTLENFKKLAFEKQYRWKMVLLVNKMSDEAGEDEEKIKNYRASLATALGGYGYSLDSFPVFFIDAKDYCEGYDSGDDFLIEISRFETFIQGLNSFIESRNSLAQLDTPIRILLDAVDDTEIAIKRDKDEDTLFLQILKKFAKVTRYERNRFLLDTQSIKSNLVSEVTRLGADLSYVLTPEEPLSAKVQSRLKQQAIQKVQDSYIDSLEQMKLVIKERSESLYNQLKEVFGSDLVKIFVERTIAQCDLSMGPESQSMNFLEGIDRIQKLMKLGRKFCLSPVEAAQRDGWLNTANFMSSGDLRVIDVYNTDLHHLVRGAGEFFGYNFELFEAASWATDIANISAGIVNISEDLIPGLTIVSSTVEMIQASQLEEQLAKKKVQIQEAFVDIANAMIGQLNQGLRQVESELFIQTEAKISEMWAGQKQSSAQSQGDAKELAQIRHDLNQILSKINQSAMGS